ncbi:MAG: iron chelate uptake ABC transporter family permease subunit, partial [Pseudomonadota bacterium]
MSVAVGIAQRSPRRSGGRRSASFAISLLLVVLLLAAIVALTVGAAGIPLSRLPAALGIAGENTAMTARDQLVLWSIRIPRIAATAMIGGLLAAAGAIMQGLFRNPL